MKNADIGAQTFFHGHQNSAPQQSFQGAPMDAGLNQAQHLDKGTIPYPKAIINLLPRYYCGLCFCAGHYYSKCPLYINEEMSENKCPTCSGYHSSPCKGTAHQILNQKYPPSSQARQPYPPGQGGQGNQGGQKTWNNNNNNNNNNGNGNNGNNGGYKGKKPYDPNQPRLSDVLAGLQKEIMDLKERNQAQQPAQQVQQQQMMQPNYQNLTHVPVMVRSGTLGNHGVQPAADGVYMSAMGAQQGQDQAPSGNHTWA